MAFPYASYSAATFIAPLYIETEAISIVGSGSIHVFDRYLRYWGRE